MDPFEILKLGRELPEKTYSNAAKLHKLLVEIADLRGKIMDWALGAALFATAFSLLVLVSGTQLFGGLLKPKNYEATFILSILVITSISLLVFLGWGIGYYRHGKKLRTKYLLLGYYFEKSWPLGLGIANFLEALKVIYEVQPSLYARVPRSIRRIFRKVLRNHAAQPRPAHS